MPGQISVGDLGQNYSGGNNGSASLLVERRALSRSGRDRLTSARLPAVEAPGVMGFYGQAEYDKPCRARYYSRNSRDLPPR